jgi:hypothetical protein
LNLEKIHIKCKHKSFSFIDYREVKNFFEGFEVKKKNTLIFIISILVKNIIIKKLEQVMINARDFGVQCRVRALNACFKGANNFVEV